MGQTINLPFLALAASKLLDNTGGHVRRVAIHNTSATVTALVKVWDGTSATSTLLDVISLTPKQSARDQYPFHLYKYHVGLYLQVVTGTVEGTFAVHHPDPTEPIGEPVIVVGGDLNVDVNVGA